MDFFMLGIVASLTGVSIVGALSAIGVVGIVAVIIVSIVVLIISLVIFGFYVKTLSKALLKCKEENRKISHKHPWLLFIPLFSFIYNFIVVINVTDSLRAELKSRNKDLDNDLWAYIDMGKSLGLWYSVLNACNLIPLINSFTLLPSFVVWILFWYRIRTYSKLLD